MNYLFRYTVSLAMASDDGEATALVRSRPEDMAFVMEMIHLDCETHC